MHYKSPWDLTLTHGLLKNFDRKSGAFMKKTNILKLFIIGAPLMLAGCLGVGSDREWYQNVEKLCSSTTQQDCIVKKGTAFWNESLTQQKALDAQYSIKILNEKNGNYFVEISDRAHSKGWVMGQDIVLKIRAKNRN